MFRLEELGLYPPNSQCAGACSTYAFRLISGTVDDSDQSFLDDNQRSDGYFLADVAYPTSDLIAERDVEEELY
jgi:ferredoxin